MSEPAPPAAAARARLRVEQSLKRRYRAERRFRACGAAAVLVGLLSVAYLFVSIIGTGVSVFRQAWMQIEVEYAADVVDPAGTRNPDDLRAADYMALVKRAMRQRFPDVEGRRDLKELYQLASDAAAVEMRRRVFANPALVGQREKLWVPASDETDQVLKGKVDRRLPETQRTVSDQQLRWIDRMAADGALELRFNRAFFTAGDSREPEQAGVWGAVKGSFYTLLITLLLSFPLGVAAAVYLEEFAGRGRFTDLIEVNINNLAAVPSIVFGLLGLAVFIQFFGVPRSAPLAGGLVLTLMTLPTIIIASRAALKSVPPSIREAALGMGASQVQVIAHHVLPLAMPGMLTGAIIGMARALGESAPLLMIGMVAFIVDVPHGITDPSTVLPVQVYLWADSPERAFLERTSGAIMVLLGFLLLMNASAVLLRQRFEKRW